MANRDDSSSMTCTVRVLVSFYLVATDDSSSSRTSPIPKEKFNVPLSGNEHKDLLNFVTHLKTFTGLADTKLDFLMYFFGKEKWDSGNWWKTCGMRDSREKGAGMRDQDPPSRPWAKIKLCRYHVHLFDPPSCVVVVKRKWVCQWMTAG